MNRIAVVTDSNSGITQKEAIDLGIKVLAMPFTIGDKEYFEDITLSQSEFYKKLEDDEEIFTSQPAVAQVLELWDELLKEYDEIIYIPMSSGLSSSYQTARMLAQDYDGKVQVVDNVRISLTLRHAIYDAINYVKQGKSAKEIKDILEDTKLDASIYIMVDTLKYLKKGGRVTAAGAAIGTVLNIKPVLQIQGDKLDAFAKVRGMKQAKKTMLDALAKDIETRFKDVYEAGKLRIGVAHTNNEEVAKEFAEELKSIYNIETMDIDPLSLSVSCHIGPGSLAVACDVVQD
ncbi:MAG: DegV family protein [Lachnospiraceae bacterium]|nr:DegV family protein [Lachnospiraceae bacterium]